MKLSIFQKMVIYIGIFFLILFLILFGLQRGSLFRVDSFIGYNPLESVQYYLFEKPATFVGDFINSFANYEKATNEIRLLNDEIKEMARIQEEIKTIKRDYEELKGLLNLQSTMTEYTNKAANIIARDEAGWHNFLTIDLGSEDGIEINQAVVNHEGLIGKIYALSDKTSIVKLITAEDGLSKVSLEIVQNIEVESMLERYDPNRMLFEVTVLDANTEIEIGSIVITSGLGGVFPRGILVGTVAEVMTANNQLGKLVYVKPAADFASFNYVMVIKRKVDTIND